jgi:hypothetical protein
MTGWRHASAFTAVVALLLDCLGGCSPPGGVAVLKHARFSAVAGLHQIRSRRVCARLAAVRDFDRLYRRFGSKAHITAPQHWRPLRPQ